MSQGDAAELTEDERQELGRLRVENARLREKVRWYDSVFSVVTTTIESARRLPLDLPDDGQQNLTPALLDIVSLEQSGLQTADG